ncbi:hypothetical protein [Runella slithyformis]|uniref:hypothetical protein n=1 Tax=Runella slithyformis TaxID=106 RepID=UPI00146AA549|nr:hypothetical protein [Runella slithyformis]
MAEIDSLGSFKGLICFLPGKTALRRIKGLFIKSCAKNDADGKEPDSLSFSLFLTIPVEISLGTYSNNLSIRLMVENNPLCECYNTSWFLFSF